MAENQIPAPDEISFASIKKAAGDALAFLFRSIDYFFLVIKRRWLFIAIFCLLGAGAAFLYHKMRPSYYESEMIVQQSSLSRKAYYEIVSNLNDLIATRSYRELAQQLSMTEPEVQKINLMQVQGLNNQPLKNDTVSLTGLPFLVQVRVQDNTVLAPLQKGLVAYLSNNDYVRRKREGQLKILTEKLAFIERQLAKLDSLKDAYTHSLAGMQMPATVYNNAVNPAELYQQSFNLATQKEYILNWLNGDANGIVLVDGFKTPQYPKQHSLLVLVLVAVVISALTAALISVLLDLKAKVIQ